MLRSLWIESVSFVLTSYFVQLHLLLELRLRLLVRKLRLHDNRLRPPDTLLPKPDNKLKPPDTKRRLQRLELRKLCVLP